jgi:aspartate aminotransferase
MQVTNRKNHTTARKLNTSGQDLATSSCSEVGHVACVGGGAFGAPDCIRMSYATSEDNLTKAFTRIKEALAKLA